MIALFAEDASEQALKQLLVSTLIDYFYKKSLPFILRRCFYPFLFYFLASMTYFSYFIIQDERKDANLILSMVEVVS